MNDQNKTKAQLINELNELRNHISVLEKPKNIKKITDNSNLNSEQLYRSIIQQSFDGFTLTDNKGIIIEWNNAQERITGIKQSEAMGKFIWDIQAKLAPKFMQPNELIKQIKNGYFEALENKSFFSKQKDHIQDQSITFVDGSVKTVQSVSFNIKIDDVQMIGTFMRDVTERKNAENELKEREMLFRILYENVNEIIFYINVEGEDKYRFKVVNPEFLKTTGLKENQVVGKLVHEVIPEPSLSLVISKYREAIQRKVSIRWEEITPYPSGNKVGDVTVTPIFDENGICTKLIGTVYDITERKNAENILRESDDRYRSLLSNTSEAIFCYEYDPPINVKSPLKNQLKQLYDGKLVECNTTAANNYGGKQREDVLGKKLTELFGAQPGDPVDDLFKTFIKNGYQTINGEGIEELSDGSKRYFSNNANGVIIEGKLIRVWGSNRDITKLKEAEQAIIKEKMFSEKILNIQPDTFFVFDPKNGKAIRWNKVFEKVSGYSSKEIAKMKAPDSFYNAKDLKKAEKFVEKVYKGKQGTVELDLICKDGKRVPTEYAVSVLENDQGDPAYFVSIGRDISDRKKAREALQKSEEKFRRIADSAPDIIYHFRLSPGPGFEFISPAVFDICGYTAQEHYDDPELGIKVVHPDDRNQLVDLYKGQLPKGPHIVRWIHKNGNVVWVEDRTTPIFNENGKMVAVEGIARDITEQKRAEQKIKESERRFRTLVEQSPYGIQVFKPDGTLVQVNKAWEKLWSAKAEQVIGTFNPLKDEQIKKSGILPFIKKSFAGETVSLPDTFFDPKASGLPGKERWLRTHAYPVKDENGEIQNVVVVNQDITELIISEKALRESEQRFRKMFETNHAVMLLIDPTNQKVVDANPAACKYYGYSRKKFIKEIFISNLNTLSEKQTKIEMNKALNEKRNYFVFQHKLNNGKIRDVEVYSSKTTINEKKLLYSIIHDITERKNAEDALRENESRLRALVSSVDEIVFEFNEFGRYENVWVSDVKLLARPVKELLGKTIVEVLGEKEAKPFMAVIKRVISSGVAENIEYSLEVMDGKRWFTARVNSIVSASGNPNRVSFIARDVTEQKQSEISLRESEQKYREMADLLPQIVFETDTVGNITFVNKQAFKTFGYKENEIKQHFNVLNNIVPEQRKIALENIQKSIKGKTVDQIEYKLLKKDGTIFPALIYSSPVIQDKKPVGLRGIIVDISERKETEEALIESEEKYRLIVENAHDGIEITQDDKLIFANSCFADMLGYSSEELKKLPFSRFFTKQALKDLDDRHKKRQKGLHFHNQYETTFQKKDGTIIDVDVKHEIIDYKGKPATFAIIRDITKQKKSEEEKNKLEKQLRHSQKLETIGTLAGGIAHDFNNILAPIMGYTDMALHKLDRSNPLYDDMQNVLKSAHRAKELVEQILLFSKQSEKERQQIKLQSLVEEALKLLRPTIPTTIDIVQNIDPACGKINADATQIHQVIINLCTNAWQVMEEKGGTLTIEMIQTKIDSSFAKLYPNLNQDDYVRLSIMDTGPGMDDETLERIFEPFFTTKAVDKGTGLGLSVVHGIVRGHKGDIIVQSEFGKGTSFHVYLPLIKQENIQKESIPSEITKGSEFVLIVDDETAVADMVKRMLENFGYQGEIYTDGLSALKAFKKNPEKYDLIITDLTMPQLTGLELADQIHEVQKSFPVLIMTGYGDSITKATQDRHGIRQVIGKPIVIRDLTNAVRKIFDN